MYTLNLTRFQLCDLLLATTYAKKGSNTPEKWKALHDEIKKQLDEQDNAEE